MKEKDELRILSYVLDGKDQSHNVGTIMASAKRDWDLGALDPSPPEVIQSAHAVILVGGFYGTVQRGELGAAVSRAAASLLPIRRSGAGGVHG